MKLTLGFSTCPNDTFIFDAMLHGKIDTEGVTFEPFMADVEELNRKAFKHNIHITKLSFHAFAYVADQYALLRSGSALGRNNGPLLISREILPVAKLEKGIVAIPGRYTTANLLFSIFYPGAQQKKELLFSEIEGALLRNEADAGVIIHENRFTFEQKGLLKIADLGELWESETGMPIPLGGIVVDRCLPPEIQLRIERILRRSVEYAQAHVDSSVSFVKKYAKELDMEVIRKHISLFVNDFTVDLGEEGINAVVRLFRQAYEKGVIEKEPQNFMAGN